jgi:hypothetical protein
MSSATEAELAALYIMAREAVYIRIILEEMGHKQPPTPIQTDNAMADAFIGYATENANSNSNFTGGPANSTMPTIGRSIIRLPIILTFEMNF